MSQISIVGEYITAVTSTRTWSSLEGKYRFLPEPMALYEHLLGLLKAEIG